MVGAELRVCDVDMSVSQRSAANSLFAEGASELVSELCVLGSESFDLGSCRVEALT